VSVRRVGRQKRHRLPRAQAVEGVGGLR
jgi:hypothetical protein